MCRSNDLGLQVVLGTVYYSLQAYQRDWFQRSAERGSDNSVIVSVQFDSVISCLVVVENGLYPYGERWLANVASRKLSSPEARWLLLKIINRQTGRLLKNMRLACYPMVSIDWET